MIDTFIDGHLEYFRFQPNAKNYYVEYIISWYK